MSFRELVEGSIVPVVDLAVIPLLYALAFLFFVYGIVRAFFSYNEEKRQEGKKFALWGIIGLVVLFSVWGFVKLLLTALAGNPLIH